MERIDDIDPDEQQRCMFMNAKCTNLGDLKTRMPNANPGLTLRWCQNCLMGKLIEELKRLRLTGIQP
jgi:hypothetical protein